MGVSTPSIRENLLTCTNGARHSSSRSRLFFLAVLGASVLTGCLDNGGGSSSNAASNNAASTGTSGGSQSSGSSNRAPTIEGSPQTQLLIGETLNFMPNVADPEGDSLIFSVSNLPGWARFSTSTGAITGSPGQGDVGTYANISISVSDGANTVRLPAFSIDVVASALGTATLSWSAPTQNTDGSPLIDLAGYKVYWGTNPGNYTNSVRINNPGLTTYLVENLTPATWYFSATAFDADGVESEFASPASKRIM